MQEYLVSCQGFWWHFFYKPSYGLCFRKKESRRFGEFEILLKEAVDDFCVLSLGNTIQIVCQDHAGAILSLAYHGEAWEKLVILASKGGKPSPKYFQMVPVGKYLNLFYVIEYKEKFMLVHQLLNSPETEPIVVDYITPSENPYCVRAHLSTDLTVCYQNAQGVCGLRTFRWSQKTYLPFVHITPGTPVFSPSMQMEEDDTCHFAALMKLENVQNLVYFRREPDGSYTEPVTIYLDCSSHPAAVFTRREQKLYLEWLDHGSVMTSYSEDDGEKWKKPVKYMRSAATSVVLYHFCQDGKTESFYGYPDNGSIQLYGGNQVLNDPPKAPDIPKFHPQGYEAAEFARRLGYRQPAEHFSQETEEYVALDVYREEIQEIREMLTKQNDIILEILRKMNEVMENYVEKKPPVILSDSALAENESDIDAIVAGNCRKEQEENSKNQAAASVPSKEYTKVVVTAQ